jgi:hypothetical protein
MIPTMLFPLFPPFFSDISYGFISLKRRFFAVAMLFDSGIFLRRDHRFDRGVLKRRFIQIGIDFPDIIEAISADLFYRLFDPFKQVRDFIAIRDRVGGHLTGQNSPIIGIHSKMYLEPASVFTPAMFFDQPLAFAIDLEPGRIKNHMQGRTRRLATKINAKATGPSRDRGIIRGLDRKSHKREDRVHESFGLAKRQVINLPKGQAGQNGQVRVKDLTPAFVRPAIGPGRDRVRAEPDRQAATRFQRRIVRRPVLETIDLFFLTMTLTLDRLRLFRTFFIKGSWLVGLFVKTMCTNPR